MANSYTQLYIHAVYAVKFRDKLLDQNWREEVFRYSSTVISSMKCKPMAINGVQDHVHLLVALHLRTDIQIRPYGAQRPHALPLLRFTPEATDKSLLRGSGVELGNVVIG
jgi:REP element-mobilizing transposase RayT